MDSSRPSADRAGLRYVRTAVLLSVGLVVLAGFVLPAPSPPVGSARLFPSAPAPAALANGPVGLGTRPGDLAVAAVHGSTLSTAGAGAGTVVRSVFPNYNGSVSGDFASSVLGWQVGAAAFVPLTGTLWLPERAVSAGGLPPPGFAPAVGYDVATGQFTGFLGSVDNASAFLFDPVNGLLYSADYSNATVGVLNASTGAWAHAAIPVGTNPTALALDPATNTLYVANAGSSNVTAVDATTNSVARAGIAVGPAPHALAFDPVDRTLFVADAGDSWVWAIATATYVAAHYAAVTGSPGGVAYSRGGGTIAVTAPQGTRLTILNATLPVTTALPNIGRGAGPVAATPNGTEFVVANASGPYLVTFNSTSGVASGPSIPVGANATALALAPTGATAFAWGATPRELSVVDLATSNVTATSPTLRPGPSGSAYDPGTDRLYVIDSYTGTVMVLNGTTGRAAADPLRFATAAMSLADDPLTGTIYVGLASGAEALDARTGLVVATASGLPGGNPALLADVPDGLLWDANGAGGLTALHLSTLALAFAVGIPMSGGNPESMTLDPTAHRLYVVNTSSGLVESVSSLTGAVVAAGIAAGPGVTAVAYDPTDDSVYALGANLTVIDPTTEAVVGSPIPVGSHTAATGLAYDPSRELLYATTVLNLPTGLGLLSAVDGSSVAASRSALVTIVVGESPVDPVPAVLAGSAPSATSAVWVENSASGTVSEVATAPRIPFFSASPSPVDVGGTSHLLVGYVGGTGPVTVAFTGLPPGCASANSLALNCTPTAAGAYVLTATVTDSLGLASSALANLSVASALSVSLSLTPGPLPVLDAGGTLVGAVSVTGGAPGGTTSWTFGDGTTAVGARVSHVYASVGRYALAATVVDSTGASVTAAAPVEVVAPPSVAVAAAPGNATDVYRSVALSATVSGGAGTALAVWTFGDGTNASGLNVSHSWSTAGSELVAFHYEDVRGTYANRTLDVTVNPALAGSIHTVGPGPTGDSSAVGVPVQFGWTLLGGTPPYSVAWSFGDGSNATGTDVVHAFAVSGTYTVRASVTDAAGATFASVVVFTVTASSGGPGVLSVTGSDFLLGLFLGLVVGGTLAAVILYLAHRARRRPPGPPSPYIPPAGASPPPWRE